MINICPSFSAVINIISWRVKSALSNVVSLERTDSLENQLTEESDKQTLIKGEGGLSPDQISGRHK